MSFEDKTIQCSDCGKTFTFSAGEQEQFQTRGYTNEPKRCPECRQARKAQQNTNGGNSYGNNSYGNSSPRQQYPAVCADCGKATTVPFEPRQGRPVYCSDCYRKVKVN
jgi:CxxC-x17-CxxC domain-containing protein